MSLLIIAGCTDSSTVNENNNNNNNDDDQDQVVSDPINNEDNESDTNSEEENTEQEDKDENDNSITLLSEIELQKGDEGEAVRTLQQVLIDLGYPLEITDRFDVQTVWAITDLQLQSEELLVTGIYDIETLEVLKLVDSGEIEIKPGSAIGFEENQSLDEETVVINNPYEVLALVNKNHALPSDYIPDDLVVPDVRFPFIEDLPKKQMRKVAAEALESMFLAADEDGIALFAQSGYRSYKTQKNLFANYVSVHGEAQANTFSARPGESEHQTGLTMDVTSDSVNYTLVTDFGDTAEGLWLEENAADYGFIIRYPEGKEEITQYQYEPWHIRYVGNKAAATIMDNNLTLEEYLDMIMK